MTPDDALFGIVELQVTVGGMGTLRPDPGVFAV